ncbi:MAG: S4 domain-containing protein [Gemmatimonadaceae bacterium]
MSDPRPGATHTIVLEADSDVRLDLLVATRVEISRTQAATLIAAGQVQVDGRRERSAYKPTAGETVTVRIPPRVARDIVPQDIPLRVIYEDAELLVIDKAAGMVVHPAPGNWDGTVVNALVGRGGALSPLGGADRPGLVHRLDKDT